MTGTKNQVEWAEQIKRQVNAEFDRVERAFEKTAAEQPEDARKDTHAIISILNEKRVEVMARDEAGYFIRDWQELRDQVRQMIAQDSRYKVIKGRRVIPGGYRQ